MDSRSACIVVLSANNDPRSVVEQYKSLGAPVVFVCFHDRLQWWRQGTSSAEWLESISHTLKNPEMAAGLIFTGKQARENENWEKLSEVISDLLNLVPETEKEKHTGIVGIT